MTRPSSIEYYTYELKQIKNQTDKAVLVELLVSGKEIWLPKKDIKIEGNKVSLPGWLKEKNKL